MPLTPRAARLTFSKSTPPLPAALPPPVHRSGAMSRAAGGRSIAAHSPHPAPGPPQNHGRNHLSSRPSPGRNLPLANRPARPPPYFWHTLCRSNTAGRFSCLQFYEMVKIILADLEPVQKWKITSLQTLKVLEIKVSCGLMP